MPRYQDDSQFEPAPPRNNGVSDLQMEQDLDEKYPNRPHNHSATLKFHTLFEELFNPLNDNKKRPTGPSVARRKQGPHGPRVHSPQEIRRSIIEKFFLRWRKEVGNDIFPALRLVIPDKDRDRAMYGLKEKFIGKILVKIMKIDRNSEDGFNLLNWKLPGQSSASRMAGDFAGRCFEVLSKRPMRTDVGDMLIEEVNVLLDNLALAPREEQQLPIFEEFYRRMNPEELMWLIRIILRQMKVGATERTFFDVWHPDAESLYSVSSSLRRVCWELYDPHIRLEGEGKGVALMQCFQPQLAQFQMHSFEKMVQSMRPTDDDPTFWIEEKLDGERLQLHMMEDASIAGGRRFGFWSRKAKEYTYLYGNGLEDENGSLTRHLGSAFADGVRSIVLDGEMVTWDPEQDAPVPFGTLKTAALAEQRNPTANGPRPLFRIFDIVYLNGQPLTRYTLRDRRKALEASVVPVNRRLEIHEYTEASTPAEIEPLLRRVVAEASEGLVLKNPRSPYRLNERHNDWMKVKPEYMTEFGESLDCVVIGGYYGSGRRGGKLSSFLCGLRVDGGDHVASQSGDQKYYSFFKCGGGYTAADYATIRHLTDGKWIDWDPKYPPTRIIELGGGDLQYERPDVWIKPEDSVVICVKAASITATDQFRMGLTLRFPRFKELRTDKDWSSALTTQEFLNLKSSVEQEKKEKEFKVDHRRKRVKQTQRRELTIAGYEKKPVDGAARVGSLLFDGLTFFVMTEATANEKISKVDLEVLLKANRGRIVQSKDADEDVVCIADRRTVPVASLQKKGTHNIVKSSWVLDCLDQRGSDAGLPDLILPIEPRHLFFEVPGLESNIASNSDPYNDSYAFDSTTETLKKLLDEMRDVRQRRSNKKLITALSSDRLAHIDGPVGWLFRGCCIYFSDQEGKDTRTLALKRKASFASAAIRSNLSSLDITHVIIQDGNENLKTIRKQIVSRKRLPKIVTPEWIERCWKERTLLDEDRFTPRN